MHEPIAIGVPLRNEVARLPRLLSALAAQQAAPPFTLCLFFDACDDGSAELADELAPQLPYPVARECGGVGAVPNVGAARAAAMRLATTHATEGVLLTTDADSDPAPTWIAANLAALSHADVIAGRIIRDDARAPDRQDRVAAYFDRLHALRRAIDPVPWEAAESHHWTSGASLAMREGTYRALGGFAPCGGGEDAALADAAARAGYRLRRDAAVVVRTSGRRHGRADRGFAANLARLDGSDRLPEVTHPEDEVWRFHQQAAARSAHAGGDVATLAVPLGLPAEEVERVAAECRNGEAFAARIVGAPPAGLRTIGLAHAEVLLAAIAPLDLEGAA